MSPFPSVAPARRAFRLALVAACLGVAAPAGAQDAAGVGNGVDDFRTKTEKWVETRQLISEERTEWEAEQETLRSTRDLLREQREALRAEIQELEKTTTQADEERRELLLERGEHQRSKRVLTDQIRSLEEEALALAPRLPEPLQETLQPLLVQIPDDPETAKVSLGQRLVNVLGLLVQAEKFNGTATLVGETRAVGGDQRVQVRTLYWGLGQAVYAAAQGDTAGLGRPGEEGWEFTDRPEYADQARLLIDIYEGNVDVIRFVQLPVEIQ